MQAQEANTQNHRLIPAPGSRRLKGLYLEQVVTPPSKTMTLQSIKMARLFASTTKIFIVASTILIFYSCRSSTDFKPKKDHSFDSSDTLITATARMWQGQYEYLGIDIFIKRTDSLFVKNISVTPRLKNGNFFPVFHHFLMYSYYYEKEDTVKTSPYWKDYFADTFDQLPTENRTTNIFTKTGNLYVKYEAHYNSTKAIRFENFAADIEVLLVDKNGQLINSKKHIEFVGKRESHFSVH